MKKLVLSIAALALIGACNIKKEEKGDLPELDVDVSADAGELPEYDVDWASVDVGTTTKMVEVPKVMIVMEKEEVEVPVIDFDMPNGDKEERTIVVEAEVSDVEHDLEIKEIRASENRLYVISNLNKLDKSIGDKTMRVQDQIELNAPELDVTHYIIGEPADNVLNRQYHYVDSMAELDSEIQNAKTIYSR